MPRFTKLKGLSPWRKVALVTWDKPSQPTVYGSYEFDATNAQALITRLNQENGTEISLTHLVAKALADTIALYPATNGIIRWGNIYLRKDVSLSVHVAMPRADDPLRDHLSVAKIENADQKSIGSIASDLKNQAKKIRNGSEDRFDKTFSIANLLPSFLLRLLVKAHEFLVFNLGVNLPKIGLIPDPFGSAMVTSVGMLGLPPGLAPLVPPSRCPLIICLGAVQKKPWVVQNEVKVRPVAGLTCTFDHRFMDGFMASRMFQVLRERLEEPQRFF